MLLELMEVFAAEQVIGCQHPSRFTVERHIGVCHSAMGIADGIHVGQVEIGDRMGKHVLQEESLAHL